MNAAKLVSAAKTVLAPNGAASSGAANKARRLSRTGILSKTRYSPLSPKSFSHNHPSFAMIAMDFAGLIWRKLVDFLIWPKLLVQSKLLRYSRNRRGNHSDIAGI
jgi:hypothetical protein